MPMGWPIWLNSKNNFPLSVTFWQLSSVTLRHCQHPVASSKHVCHLPFFSYFFSILTFLYPTEELLVSADGVVCMLTTDRGPIAADTIHNKKSTYPPILAKCLEL